MHLGVAAKVFTLHEIIWSVPMSASRTLLTAFCLVLLAGISPSRAEVGEREVSRAFLTLVAGGEGDMRNAMHLIESTWEPSYLSMALDVIRLVRNPAVSATLLRLIARKAGGEHGYDLGAWQRAMWNAPEARHPRYAAFKGALYGFIDPRFPAYFDEVREPLIRLDEIVWGGVRQDGIPPLRDPAMIAGDDAGYLEDDHIVFGISVNGDARAYPKRILGWHEMFVDVVGGVPVAGLYCTLCGTVILYFTEHASVMQTATAASSVCVFYYFLCKQGVVTATASPSFPFRTSDPRHLQDTIL